MREEFIILTHFSSKKEKKYHGGSEEIQEDSCLSLFNLLSLLCKEPS